MEPTQTTMHAVRMHAFGGPDVLEYEEVPLPPAPTGNQVLVRVRAAGVGPWDGEVRRGEWRGMVDYPLPLILGLDLSGLVAALGPDAHGLTLGQEVYGVADMMLSGSNADYALCHADHLAPEPTSLNHIQASSVPVAAVTAFQMVHDLAQIAPGQSVLVLGAGGSLGAYAVQFARQG